MSKQKRAPVDTGTEPNWGEGPIPDSPPFDVPEGVVVTRDNCRNYIPHWIEVGRDPDAPTEGSYSGSKVHCPDPTADEPEPLCDSFKNNGKWQETALAVYPPGYLGDDICSKCLAFANGWDYISDRGESKQ